MNRTLAFAALVATASLASVPAALAQTADPPGLITSVSGQLRFRGELTHELDFNDGVDNAMLDDRRVLSRARVRVDATPVEHLTAVVEFQDSRWFGTEPSTATNQASFGLHQGYLTATGVGGSVIDVMVGRQELSYGDQRLIGAFDWSNTGRAFDGIRGRIHANDQLTVDVFGTRIHDDRTVARSLGDDFAGAYAMWKTEGMAADGYALYLHDHGGRLDTDGDGMADTDRFPGGGALHLATVGGRFDGSFGAIGVNGEAAVQAGERGDLSVLALAAHARVAYTFAATGKPAVHLGGAYATGDSDPTDDAYGTFENLFPTNHLYYGYADAAAWKNLIEVYGKLTAAPADGWNTIAAVHVLSRANTEDAFYRASGVAYGPGGASDAAYVGTELDLLGTWKASPELAFLGGLSYVLAGGYLDDAAGGDAADGVFGYLQMQGNF